MSAALIDTSRPALKPAPLRIARHAWMGISVATAAVLGVLPHVLHHVGPLAGAALFAGATGSLLFGAIGFVAAIPFLRRVRRRCGNWHVPAAILAAMAIVFSLSTFVVWPAITGSSDDGDRSSESAPAGERPGGHKEHH